MSATYTRPAGKTDSLWPALRAAIEAGRHLVQQDKPVGRDLRQDLAAEGKGAR